MQRRPLENARGITFKIKTSTHAESTKLNGTMMDTHEVSMVFDINVNASVLNVLNVQTRVAQ